MRQSNTIPEPELCTVSSCSLPWAARVVTYYDPNIRKQNKGESKEQDAADRALCRPVDHCLLTSSDSLL